jgi:hypothetical protein
MERFGKLIRHLVLCVQNRDWSLREPGWEWPLKVDWKTLPHLDTLCLDIRSYSRRESSGSADLQEDDDEKLIEGAVSMECLNLKGLFWSEFAVNRIIPTAVINAG